MTDQEMNFLIGMFTVVPFGALAYLVLRKTKRKSPFYWRIVIGTVAMIVLSLSLMLFLGLQVLFG